MTRTDPPRFRTQQGAALIVGMVLLVVLTLLAISGMNTATTELLMAGNEKYQENAFQAAETGIERTMATAAFNPAAMPPPDPPQVDLGDGSNYEAIVVPRGSSPPPPGISYRVVNVVGADGSCDAGEMLLSAYCFSDRGRGISASGPALQPDADGRLVATCLTGGRNLRLFCVKQ